MNTTAECFHLVESRDYPTIVELLKKRIPVSAHIYNMSLVLDKFPNEMFCYTLFGKLDETAIVLIILHRQDYGQDINISLPDDFNPTEEIKSAFTTTQAIKWDEGKWFCAIDSRISHLLFEISTKTYGHSVMFYPHYSYWMEPEDETQIDIEDTPGVEIKPLDLGDGLKFIVETWIAGRPGSEEYARRIIRDHISCGVSVDGKIVSGGFVNWHGLLGALHTLPDTRKGGFATKCVKYLLKDMATRGFVPASATQMENVKSQKLHERAGMKISHKSDYMFHIPIIKND